MLRAGLFCPQCATGTNRIENYRLLDDLNNLEAQVKRTCDKCRSIVLSHYVTYDEEKEASLDEWFDLPHASAYFHLNQTIDYSDEAVKASEFCRDKRVLLVGCGGMKRAQVLMSIRRLRFKKLVCVSRQKEWAFGFVDDWICGEHEDIKQADLTLTAIKDFCFEHGNMTFDCIFTYDDAAAVMTSYLQAELGLDKRAIPYELMSVIKDKYEFRELCTRLEINHPNYFLLDYKYLPRYLDKYRFLYASINKQPNEISQALKNYLHDLSSSNGKTMLELAHDHKRCMYPVVIKNIWGMGKDFARKCKNLKEVCECLVEILQEYSSHEKKINFIVEEYFDGHEIDLDMLIQDGEIKFLAINDNFPQYEPWFFEVGSMSPSVYLCREEKHAVQRILDKWTAKMGLRNALIHFEARCRPRSLYSSSYEPQDGTESGRDYENWLVENEDWFIMPIEINPRLGGDEAWASHLCAYNVNLIHEYFKIAFGVPLDAASLKERQERPRFRCLSKDIHPVRNIRIDRIILKQNEIACHPDIVEVSLFKAPGDVLSFRNAIGYFLIKTAYNEKDEEKDLVRPFLDRLFDNEQKACLSLVSIDLTEFSRP